MSNATRLDLTLISHGPVILTPGSVLRVEDGEVFLGGMHYYSDPTNPVNIIVEKQGTRITGKGIGIASDTVYCFGF
ncbi:MAG: hypothetical protein HY695_24755 [Deltaproteobacteria bacterium]|nr:hypothetical protein [Deltaproteobacteria bacterium]